MPPEEEEPPAGVERQLMINSRVSTFNAKYEDASSVILPLQQNRDGVKDEVYPPHILTYSCPYVWSLILFLSQSSLRKLHGSASAYLFLRSGTAVGDISDSMLQLGGSKSHKLSVMLLQMSLLLPLFQPGCREIHFMVSNTASADERTQSLYYQDYVAVLFFSKYYFIIIVITIPLLRPLPPPPPENSSTRKKVESKETDEEER